MNDNNNRAPDSYCNMQFTPNELMRIKSAHLKHPEFKFPFCPFCMSSSSLPKDIQRNRKSPNLIVYIYTCPDCDASWSYTYIFEKMDFLNIPDRSALSCEKDKILNKTIEFLRQEGNKYMAQRLEKLFIGD